jgi:dTDP-4-dehydrorhamnose 3,5-epimerase-like enzyme
MSSIKKIKTFFSDPRGEIIDILTNEPKDHCAIVTFTKDAIRGNHFHKKSIQSAYVLEGSFEVYDAIIDSDSKYESSKVKNFKINKGNYITHEEYEAHTYKCISLTGCLLVFTKGVRGGEYYEDDTFRLKKKLI